MSGFYSCRRLITIIMGIARKLGLSVVAEGVETVATGYKAY